MANIPRSLDEFLASVTEDMSPLGNIDQLLTTHVWAKKFHEYLLSKNLTDDILTLKFLISVSLLENLNSKLKKMSRVKMKQKLHKVSHYRKM